MRFLFFSLIVFNFLFGYYKIDPKMISVSGAYNTLAVGYQSVGVNPANLAFSNGTSINLMSMNFGVVNNFLTKERVNNLRGADLENENAVNYFPKEKVLNFLGDESLLVSTDFDFPVPFLNFSTGTNAFSTSVKSFSKGDISQDLVKLTLYGNEIDSIYNFRIDNTGFISYETSFSKGFKFGNFGFGFTVKHLKGIIGFSYEALDESEFITTVEDVNLSKSSYLIRQNTMGDGLGLDLGIALHDTTSGWKFGMSIINIFSSIDWNKKSFLDDSFDSFYSTIYEQTDLNYNQNFYLDVSINNLNLDTLNNDVELSDLFIVDTLKVYEGNIPLIENSYYSPITDKYYTPTDSLCLDTNPECVDYLNDLPPSIIKLDYPTTFNLGLSKRVNDKQLYMLDLSTGFDNSFNNIEKWKLAIAAEFGGGNFPFRIGYSYGGNNYMSIGMGFGIYIPTNKGKFAFDLGLGYKGSYNFNSANGFNFGFGWSWLGI